MEIIKIAIPRTGIKFPIGDNEGKVIFGRAKPREIRIDFIGQMKLLKNVIAYLLTESFVRGSWQSTDYI